MADAEAQAQARAAAKAKAVQKAERRAAAEAEAAALAEATRLAEEQALAQLEARLAAQAKEVRRVERQAAADAEAEAIAAAEVEAARRAKQEALAEAHAIADVEARALKQAERQAAAEAQALAAAEAEAARVAEEQALKDAETQAAAVAQAQTEAARLAAQASEGASVVSNLVDPTIREDYEIPAAAVQSSATPRNVSEESISLQSVRTSAQEFATTLNGESASDAQDVGLTNIEKALLLGLGAVIVGSTLRNGDRVVANTGDRVVVEGTRGLTVYKDDDALLRQPGTNLRTESYADGSTRTMLDRDNGAQVVTIRDPRGRVLRRTVVNPDGTQYALFDDLRPEPAVDVRELLAARPDPRIISAANSELIGLRAALREDMAVDAGRRFSLRQIREIEQVRSLVPAIELDTVSFATGSAAISAPQVRKLLRLGILIEEMLLEDPREMFLIEGHSDAVGSGSQNLALSDRRAESIALALTENFRIPPENLVVQGYGESFPRVETQSAEERNRRVTARRITPLLEHIAQN